MTDVFPPELLPHPGRDSIRRSFAALFQRGTNLIAATAMTVGILFMMTQMVSNELPPPEKEVVTQLPNIHFIEKEPAVETVKPTMEKLKDQPVVTQITFDSRVSEGDIDSTFVPSDTDPIIDPTMQTGIPGGMAMVPISPQYPTAAISRGLCGHVIVQFDIGDSGIPTNVMVLETTNRVFNRNAISAVERARYKPHTEGGKPAPVLGKQEKISFIMDDGC